jgi:hypothetical protein
MSDKIRIRSNLRKLELEVEKAGVSLYRHPQHELNNGQLHRQIFHFFNCQAGWLDAL